MFYLWWNRDSVRIYIKSYCKSKADILRLAFSIGLLLFFLSEGAKIKKKVLDCAAGYKVARMDV